MTEFKTWVDDPPSYLSGDLNWWFKSAPRHYSIDGVEVSKEQFEIAQASTFEKKPKPTISGCMACAFHGNPYHAFGTPCPLSKVADQLEGKTLAGHNLGGYSHAWSYDLETDRVHCTCGLIEDAYDFEMKRGMKTVELPYRQGSPLVPCLPCANLGWPDHSMGVVCPARAKQANAIDWARM